MPKAAAPSRYWLALQIDTRRRPSRRGRAQGRRRPARAADADRQGLPHRQRLRDAPTSRMQVFGGHGYIREWGMEQYVRDARINMIYEGTNTHPVARPARAARCCMDNGAKLRKFGAQVKALRRRRRASRRSMAEFVKPLADLATRSSKLTMEIGMKAMQNPDEVGAAAVPTCAWSATWSMSYFWARMAKIALDNAGLGRQRSTSPSWPPRASTSRGCCRKPRC